MPETSMKSQDFLYLSLAPLFFRLLTHSSNPSNGSVLKLLTS